LGGSVVKKDFEDIVTGRARIEIGSAYVLCVQTCVHQVGGWARQFGRTDPVLYVFGDGVVARDKTEVLDLFEKYLASDFHVKTFLIRGAKFASTKSVVELQTADVAAYEMRKQMLRNIGADTRPVRKSMVNLLAMTHKGGYWDKDNLPNLVKNVLEGKKI